LASSPRQNAAAAVLPMEYSDRVLIMISSR
jgi:hypothetical protein